MYSFKKHTYTSPSLIPIILGMLLAFEIIFKSDYSEGATILIFVCVIPFIILFIYIGILQLYYIEVNSEKLVIRNLVLFWIKKEYAINSINYISYKEKYGVRYKWDGIEIFSKNTKKGKVYWLGGSFQYMDTFWQKVEKQLNKVSIQTLNFNNRF